MFTNLIRSFPLDGLGRIRLSLAGAFTLAIAYGGGFWLQLVHTVEGATELDEPPLIVHWLRDSTLALPIVFAGVWLALLLVRRVVEPRATRWSSFLADMMVATIVAATTSALVAAVSPIHETLFGAHIHGTTDVPYLIALIARDSSIPAAYRQLLLEVAPVVIHAFNDGFSALGANFAVATVVMAMFGEERQVVDPERHDDLERRRGLASHLVAEKPSRRS